MRSACLVYGPDGERVARYDKMHLFAFSDGDERYDEARTIEPGERVVAFDAPCGRVGLSICYDIRFPELYRALGDLALILMPAAFTVPTGTAHWELLLRARAVENQCYLLAAAQGGMHPNGRATYGHSMLVDPWGDIVAEHASRTRRRRRRCGCCADGRSAAQAAGVRAPAIERTTRGDVRIVPRKAASSPRS